MLPCGLLPPFSTFKCYKKHQEFLPPFNLRRAILPPSSFAFCHTPSAAPLCYKPALWDPPSPFPSPALDREAASWPQAPAAGWDNSQKGPAPQTQRCAYLPVLSIPLLPPEATSFLLKSLSRWSPKSLSQCSLIISQPSSNGFTLAPPPPPHYPTRIFNGWKASSRRPPPTRPGLAVHTLPHRDFSGAKPIPHSCPPWRRFPTLPTQFAAPDIRRQLPEGCTDTGPHLRIHLLKLIRLSPSTELHRRICRESGSQRGKEEQSGREGQDPLQPPLLPEKL